MMFRFKNHLVRLVKVGYYENKKPVLRLVSNIMLSPDVFTCQVICKLTIDSDNFIPLEPDEVCINMEDPDTLQEILHSGLFKFDHYSELPGSYVPIPVCKLLIPEEMIPLL